MNKTIGVYLLLFCSVVASYSFGYCHGYINGATSMKDAYIEVEKKYQAYMKEYQ